MMYQQTNEELEANRHRQLVIEQWQKADAQDKLNKALYSVYLSIDWHKNILLTINTTLRIESLRSLLNAFKKHKKELESIKEKFKTMNVNSLRCNKLLLETNNLLDITFKKINDEQKRTTKHTF
jgi:hypothetical protein